MLNAFFSELIVYLAMRTGNTFMVLLYLHTALQSLAADFLVEAVGSECFPSH